MTAGIQVFNADGSLQFDLSSRAYRVVTVADIGAAQAGSATVDLSSGSIVLGMVIADGKKAPTITASSSGYAWDYGAIPSGDRDTNFQIELAVY